MRGLLLSFSQPSTILLSGLLLLSTHFLWAQRTWPVEKIAIQLLDTPAPFARLSQAQAGPHLTYGRLPLTRLPLTFEHKSGPNRLADEILASLCGLLSSAYQYQCRAVKNDRIVGQREVRYWHISEQGVDVCSRLRQGTL
jgi:hypothetical protein